MRVAKVKPLAGQLSLLGDLPVKYCPVCGRRLTSDRSHKTGIGPGCRKRKREIVRHELIGRLFGRMVYKARHSKPKGDRIFEKTGNETLRMTIPNNAGKKT